MKKLLIVICILLSATICVAAEYSTNFTINTGDNPLDLFLKGINIKASTSIGAKEVKIELNKNYSITDKQIQFLSKQGYTLAEIQYLAMLAKQSGKTIYIVSSIHHKNKGVGWGVLAKKLGVKPSALRKYIVQNKKQNNSNINKGSNKKPDKQSNKKPK